MLCKARGFTFITGSVLEPNLEIFGDSVFENIVHGMILTKQSKSWVSHVSKTNWRRVFKIHNILFFNAPNKNTEF